jgi:hypothetical protein
MKHYVSFFELNCNTGMFTQKANKQTKKKNEKKKNQKTKQIKTEKYVQKVYLGFVRQNTF